MSAAQLTAKAARFRAQALRLTADELRTMAEVYRLEGLSDFASAHLKLAASYDEIAVAADKDAEYWDSALTKVAP